MRARLTSIGREGYYERGEIKLVKSVAVYGTFEKKVRVRQRYWKWVYHRTGSKAGQKWYKRRVWKYPKGRYKTVKVRGRYEFYGSGKELYQAIRKAIYYVPKRKTVSVNAEDFVRYPLEYGDYGTWIEYDVES
jgi:hypothetical protein